MLTLAPCVLVTLLCAPPAADPPTAERVQQLIKKLEVPTRSQTDQKSGPPDYPWPTFNYRWHGGEEIAELKRAGDVAVPALLALLEDESKPGQARAHAAMILMERLVGTKVKPNPEIIDAINAALKDKDPALRYGVLFHLLRRGLVNNREIWKTLKSDEKLQKYIKDALPPEERSFTAAVMDDFLPQVIDLLADEHPEIVAEAASTIVCFGRPNAGVAELLAVLKRKEPNLRAVAAGVLGRVGRGDPAVAKAVIEQIDPTQPLDVYAQVIRAVGEFGPEAKAAVPQLIKAVKNERRHAHSLRDNAVRSLGNIGPDAKEAIPLLLDCLSQKYYPADPSADDYYLGSKEEVMKALERIDPEAGKKGRAIYKRKQQEYFRWLESLSPPLPPNIPPDLPPIQP